MHAKIQNTFTKKKFKNSLNMKISVQYSNNWETMEKEDDINQYFWYCYKANSFNVIKSLI